jgi:hypothetical protein
MVGLAVLAGVGIGFSMTRSLTRALGAEPAELAEVAGRIAQGSLADDGRLAGPAGSVMASMQAMRRRWCRWWAACAVASRAWPRPVRRSRRATATCPAAPKSRPPACSRPRRRWNSSPAPCAPAPTTPARPASWPKRASAAPQRGGEVVSQVVQTMGEIQGRQQPHRRDHRRDRRHCLPDQHPGAERRGGSRACRRTGPRLCRGGQRSAHAGAAQCRRGAEIKSLIGDSVAKVEAGGSPGADAGTTMGRW